jgi:hypothetical protein
MQANTTAHDEIVTDSLRACKPTAHAYMQPEKNSGLSHACMRDFLVSVEKKRAAHAHLRPLTLPPIETKASHARRGQRENAEDADRLLHS